MVAEKERHVLGMFVLEADDVPELGKSLCGCYALVWIRVDIVAKEDDPGVLIAFYGVSSEGPSVDVRYDDGVDG